MIRPTDVGNPISGSSAFSKSSLHGWKFRVHVLLKPGLENFEHYFTSLWDECTCAVAWAFFGIAFLWDWNEDWPLSRLVATSWVFRICYANTFTASSFRIWNSPTGIPSPPLTLFGVKVPEAQPASQPSQPASHAARQPPSIPGCLALDEWSHHHDYLGQEALFCKRLLKLPQTQQRPDFPTCPGNADQKPALVCKMIKLFLRKTGPPWLAQNLKASIRATRLNLEGNTTQKTFLSNSIISTSADFDV